jgi:hypothetical protein
VLTRTLVGGVAISLVAAGSLAAGLAVSLSGHPGASARAGLVARPASSPSSPGRDNAGARPAGAGTTSREHRSATSASKDQPGADPAGPGGSAAAPPGKASPSPTTTATSPSYYTVDNKAHDLCLNAMNHVDTAQVDVADCNGSWYQDWTGLKDGSAEEVVNKESGLCLNAKSIATGADVDIATCNGSRNQLWLVDGARLYLEDGSSNLCLGGDSPATNESPAGAATCGSGTNQQWSW